MLPPLIFGNNRATTETNLNRFRDSIGQFCNTMTSMESTIADRDFRQKTSHVEINDLALTATASTPVALATEDTNAQVISIALNSKASTSVNGKTHDWQAGRSAFYSAGEKRSGSAGHVSLLNIRPNMDRLKHTAATMLGGSSTFGNRHLSSQPIALSSHGVDFDRMIRHSCAAMDSLQLCPATLKKLGFDDVLYRISAMMLAPDLFISQTSNTVEKNRLDRVCDYVMANLFNTITLTDLENVAMLSGRALQYAFMKTYGCSPMAWVRQQRLLKARDHLLSAQPGTTVTTIAIECGFRSNSAFSTYYQQQFGERPSETLLRANH